MSESRWSPNEEHFSLVSRIDASSFNV